MTEIWKDDGDGSGKSNHMESIYNHAFLCGLDRSKYGIVKMLIPSDIAKTDIFKTGVENKKTDEVVEEPADFGEGYSYKDYEVQEEEAHDFITEYNEEELDI